MVMARKSGYQTRFPPVLRHKRQFAYESSAPSAVRADRYGEHKSKLNHKVSDCVVACSARALSLIGPPSPRSIGTTHATIGLFRGEKWAPNGDAPGDPRVPRPRALWPRELSTGARQSPQLSPCVWRSPADAVSCYDGSQWRIDAPGGHDICHVPAAA